MTKKQRNVVNASTVAAITETLGRIVAQEFDYDEIVDNFLLVKEAVEGGDDSQQNKLIEKHTETDQLDHSCIQRDCSLIDSAQHKKNILVYVFGSIATFGVASWVVPKVCKKIVNNTYKFSVKKQNKKEDDWGPEIVEKTNDK